MADGYEIDGTLGLVRIMGRVELTVGFVASSPPDELATRQEMANGGDRFQRAYLAAHAELTRRGLIDG